MQKFGFFNALIQGGEPDRKYNANDYSDNLAVVISNGVLRSENDDLKVTADGMAVKVNIGRAWIKGHYYYNTSEYQFEAVSAPTGGSRYDRVMLRFNNDINSRSILLTYVQGTAAAEPTPPAPVREGNIYDLVIADVYVGANATSVTVTDQRQNKNLCGWIYSTAGDNSFFESLDESFYEWFSARKDELLSVTLFKRYTWETQLVAAGTTVQFNIPQYETDTCFIEVFVNGILENQNSDYTLSGNIITFDGVLIAGTEITVKCYKSIDGTGIMSVADEITELQNQMQQVQGNGKYVYKCTGLNDNLSISQIAHAIITNLYNRTEVTTAAAAFLQGLGGTQQAGDIYSLNFAEDAQIGIDVVGDCGVTTPYGGAGTQANPYKWFNIGESNGATYGTSKRIIFDFAKCNKITVSCSANTYNYIFYGTDLTIKNVRCFAAAAGAGCAIYAVMGRSNNGRINVDSCRFTITATALGRIADHGTFTNCYGLIKTENGAAYCFSPKSTGLIRIIGGEYYAYAKTSSGQNSAIFYTTASDVDGACIAQNIHCPVNAITGYTQNYLSIAYAGSTVIQGVVTRLTSLGDYNSISGKIDRNKV